MDTEAWVPSTHHPPARACQGQRTQTITRPSRHISEHPALDTESHQRTGGQRHHPPEGSVTKKWSTSISREGPRWSRRWGSPAPCLTGIQVQTDTITRSHPHTHSHFFNVDTQNGHYTSLTLPILTLYAQVHDTHSPLAGGSLRPDPWSIPFYPIYPSTYPSTYLPIHLLISYLSMHLLIHLPIYPPIYLAARASVGEYTV